MKVSLNKKGVTFLWLFFIVIGIASEVTTLLIDFLSFNVVESIFIAFASYVIIYCLCSALKRVKQKGLFHLSHK